jgi:hypothetical protein
MSDEMVTVAITLRATSDTDKSLDGATSVIVIDTWPEGGEIHGTGDGWRPAFQIPRSKLGNGGDMTVTCDGYVTRKARIITPPAEPDKYGLRVENDASKAAGDDVAAIYAVMDQEFLLDVERPRVELLPLVVDGKHFRYSDGGLWTQIGCSDFRLLERKVRGEDIEPILAERAAIGFNSLRIFLMCGNMFNLYPHEHDNYWQAFDDLVDIDLPAHGLRCELTVLVDATRVMPALSTQQNFFRDVCGAVAGLPHVFIELVNENDQPINTIQAQHFTQPGGPLISSHGSKGVVDAAHEAVCVDPLWTYGTLHPARPADWPRLGGHNTMEDVAEKFGKPGTDNESCRPDQGRGPVASDWFDAAGNIALLCAGGTFHSECGKDSRLFDPTERSCAEAWTAGARAVPLDYQRGQYIAGHLTGYPLNWTEGDSSRAHGRLGGDRACCSLPQMRDGYTPTARDGWTIVRQQGSVVEVVANGAPASATASMPATTDVAKRLRDEAVAAWREGRR